MGIDWPITPGAFLSVFGVAFFSSLLLLWVKQWVKEARIYNVIGLGVSEGLAFLVQFALAQGRPDAIQLISAALIGFFGTTLACWGYETITNLVGLIGFGKRSDKAILEKAEALCQADYLEPHR